ncbi:TPA: hypothetical protein U1220_000444 [Streptococcus suis]|nr:hypothetical protein [Streptococcus suis]
MVTPIPPEENYTKLVWLKNQYSKETTQKGNITAQARDPAQAITLKNI